MNSRKLYYRKWYLERYGYKTEQKFKIFLEDKDYILDAGCGLGRDSKFFAELNPEAWLLSIDQSPYAIEIVRKK